MFKNKKHFKCLLWKGLWGVSFVSLVLACVSIRTGAFIWLTAEHWFWGALILGVLSIPIKLDCHDCSVCVAAK